jgi:NDP-sugar pyrophosphorylase family protein
MVDTAILVLAGGLGSRLQTCLDSKTPKFLAPIYPGTFADWFCTWLIHQNVYDLPVYFCLGHLSLSIQEYLQSSFPRKFNYIIEPRKLGTLGAVHFASQTLPHTSFIILNGDTIVDLSFKSFCDFSFNTLSLGLPTLALSPLHKLSASATTTGLFELTSDKLARRLNVDSINHQSFPYLSSGVMFLHTQLLSKCCDIVDFNTRQLDINKDLISSNLINPYLLNAHSFFDIGLPETFEESSSELEKLFVSMDIPLPNQ